MGRLKAFRKRRECGGLGTDSEGARLRLGWKILHKEKVEPGISGQGVENNLENREKLRGVRYRVKTKFSFNLA